MTAKGKYTKKKHIQDISVSPMSHANQCLQYLKQISWLVSFFNSVLFCSNRKRIANVTYPPLMKSRNEAFS